ncbi:hypothetical protein TSMEX_007058 [Taenia solium]|eukprot:TsM_000597600 transcript=TsM_000597600 gene=TsM_000597600
MSKRLSGLLELGVEDSDGSVNALALLAVWVDAQRPFVAFLCAFNGRAPLLQQQDLFPELEVGKATFATSSRLRLLMQVARGTTGVGLSPTLKSLGWCKLFSSHHSPVWSNESPFHCLRGGCECGACVRELNPPPIGHEAQATVRQRAT